MMPGLFTGRIVNGIFFVAISFFLLN